MRRKFLLVSPSRRVLREFKRSNIVLGSIENKEACVMCSG